MVIKHSVNNDTLEISIEGRLDAAASDDLRSFLFENAAGFERVIFDMRLLEYISSAGLRQLLTVRKRLRSNDDIRVINCSLSIMDIFRTTGFDALMYVAQAEDSIEPSAVSFKELLKHQVHAHGDEVFLDDGNTYTWRELDQCAQILASDLAKAGVQQNDHVGICSENSVNWIIAFFAVQKIGAIAMLLNCNLCYSEIIELSRLGDITHICFGGCPALPPFEELKPQIENDAESYAKTCVNISREICFKDRLNEYDKIASLFQGKVDSDDASLMIFSSGTTGKPKGVLLSAYNILSGAAVMADRLHINEQDSSCLVIPMFHIFGLMVGIMTNALHHARIYIPSDLHKGTIISLIEEKKPTIMHAVPTIMLAIINSSKFTPEKLKSIRTTVMAGSATAEAQMLKLMDTLPNNHFVNAYGLSEMAPVSMTEYEDSPDHIIRTAGMPVKGVNVRIFDTVKNEDCAVGDGRFGEILVRGYNMMTCYYKQDIEDQSVDDEDWLHTGDLGYIDEEGYLHIVGRSKELIIRGGENIIPHEVVEAITTHENVKDARVLGIPDSFYGEAVAACLTLKDPEKWDPQEMTIFLKGKIAKFKIPSVMKVFRKFPLLSNGKVDMISLKDLLLEQIHEENQSN